MTWMAWLLYGAVASCAQGEKQVSRSTDPTSHLEARDRDFPSSLSDPGREIGRTDCLNRPSAPSEPEAGDRLTSAWVTRPNVGYGLFDVVSLSPFTSLRSGFSPLMPSSLDAGTWEVKLVQSWAKDFTATPTALIDFEVLRTAVAVSWAVSDSWTLHLQVDACERAPGGALGEFIVEFHRVFGIRNYYKPYPNDYYRFNVTQTSQNLSIDVPSSDPQPFESSCVVSVQKSLTPGDDVVPELSAGLGLRRELVPGDLRGGSPVDVSISLSAAKAVGDFIVYAGANVDWFGQEDFFGLELRPLGWSVLAGVEWHCLSHFSLVAGYLLTRGVVPRLAEFSLPSNEVSAGIRWELVPGVLLSMGILENVINPYNSPDFGFQAELAFRW
jgi:hypothetical protein